MKHLLEAVEGYNYPCILFDFVQDEEISFSSFRELEKYISYQLYNEDIDILKNGLSNVLYWGHYRAGYKDVRVNRFRDKVLVSQLENFRLNVTQNKYSLLSLKKIGMPEYSQMAFISKILMFLKPSEYVTLDKKIMQLKNADDKDSPLSRIKYSSNDTSIRISRESQDEYLNWCRLCKNIAKNNFRDKLAVDIERGFFKLVETGKTDLAKQIIKENYSLLLDK